MDIKSELEKEMNMITVKLYKKIADINIPYLSERYDELKISFEEKQEKLDLINAKLYKKIEEKKRLEEEKLKEENRKQELVRKLEKERQQHNQQQEEIRQEEYFRSRGWGTMTTTPKQDFDDKFYGTGRWTKK